MTGGLILALVSALWNVPLPAQELDQDEFLLKPLVKPEIQESKHPESPQSTAAGSAITTLHGSAEKGSDVSAARSRPPVVLTGKVQTLQQAIDSEKDFVDWYAWYLACRDYLARTGGLHCALGTPIKFYRDGHIEPLTFDTACLTSLEGRSFPLPPRTRLDALILPVRHGNAPPATRSEIYSRVRTLQD